MTHTPLRQSAFRFLAVATLVVTAALPASAAVKRRAALSGDPAVATSEATITGTVIDADTGAPVAFATIDAQVRRTSTDANGHYTIKAQFPKTFTLIVRRTGYEDASQTVTITGAEVAVTSRLKSRPTIRLRTTAGVSYDFDYETAQFAFLVPLSGYIRSDAGNFCRGNGEAYTPDKSELKRVIGPVTQVDSSACCPNNRPLQSEVETKAGQRFTVVYVDSCLGTEVDFIGRDHVTGQFIFTKMQDVAEIVFP